MADSVTFEQVPAESAFRITLSDITLGFLSQQFKFKSSFMTLKGAVNV